jgi:DNA-binding transcriptional ArsR family regulator
MANTELRRQLEQLAQQFVDGVINAINSVPLAEIAQEVRGGRVSTGLRATVPVRGEGAGRRGRPAKVEAEPVRRGGRPERRKLVRRSGGEIDRLRSSILASLRGAPGPIGASEIARKIGGGIKSAQLAFPMAQLRKQGLVTKQGERTQAVYSLTAKGKAPEGGARAPKATAKKKAK